MISNALLQITMTMSEMRNSKVMYKKTTPDELNSMSTFVRAKLIFY